MEYMLKRIEEKIKELQEEKSTLYDLWESNYEYDTEYVEERIRIVLAKIDVLKELIGSDKE